MKILTSIWIVLITVMIGVGLRVYDVEPLKILRLKTFVSLILMLRARVGFDFLAAQTLPACSIKVFDLLSRHSATAFLFVEVFATCGA